MEHRNLLRRGGTCVLNGLPPGESPVSIFDLVLNGYTIRGSIVGTRIDLEEALSFAAEGEVKAIIETQPLESINDAFQRLRPGRSTGESCSQSGRKRPRRHSRNEQILNTCIGSQSPCQFAPHNGFSHARTKFSS
jgi:hypothetical protein